MKRRSWLKGICRGLSGLAIADLLAREIDNSCHGAIEDQGLPPGCHFPPRVKRVIFVFMHGGPSHVDTFDYKPELIRLHGQPLPIAKPRIQFAQTGNLLKSPWEFKQYGESGAWVSDLFPNVAKHVDRLTFIKSLHGSNEAHGGALLKIHTGTDTFVRPSLGAWVSYGLGTQNTNLPSFITINPTLGHGGVRNFGSAFLPPNHQGTRIAVSGKDARIENLVPKYSDPLQRLQLDYVRDLEQLGPSSTLAQALDAKEKTYELAYRMQSEALGRFKIDSETQETLNLYGIDGGPTDGFGRQCLLARRLSEAGVRFVQVSHAYWDQHAELKEKHAELATQVDRPIAGLIEDLHRRGLLSETLLIWGGEFGRTPTAQGDNGRDHNPHAFTWWMCGPGIKPGFSWGQSDDFGFYAQQDKVHVHDLHATLLHLLGIDHEKLTFRYGGRDFRLTDIHGRVVKELLS
ncbi:MAG: DUF1501 domain-containing protein [Planctomycetaceae bacterium]|jgi:hypothetical protein|nr:DUF1501 domain-containing protein [Planctomycetaceae bacterium]MCE2812788.1 DUF1501 domain-containing protein [Planctomycetaceae bacterium]